MKVLNHSKVVDIRLLVLLLLLLLFPLCSYSRSSSYTRLSSYTRSSSYSRSSSYNKSYTCVIQQPRSRLKVPLDIQLLVPKPVHRNPVPHLLHPLPHLGVPLLDPGLDFALLVHVDGCVVPVTQPTHTTLVFKHPLTTVLVIVSDLHLEIRRPPVLPFHALDQRHRLVVQEIPRDGG